MWFYHKHDSQYLGLNPNDVAIFIVVVILSLPVLLKFSKRCIWFIWPMEVLLLALLIGTGSRGSVLALICGLLVWLILSWRDHSLPRGWKAWTSIGLVIFLGVSLGLMTFPKGFRLGTVDVSPEASAGRRLQVWSTVPAMLASAPNGWGFGKSAEAYEQWFEPVGEEVILKHLLSSHLTWLVEFGWPLRWLYVFLWMAAFGLLLPNRRFNFSIWGIAIWAAFLVALFYNAAGKWWNWPLPALWVITALVLRFRQKAPLSQGYWILSAVVAGILVGLPFMLLGLGAQKLSVDGRSGGNIVLVGSGKPTLAILGPNKEVLGNFYGQEIRREWSKGGQNAGSVVIIAEPTSDLGKLLNNCQLYVISGAEEDTLKKWELIFAPKPDSKLLLINCRVEPDDWFKGFSRVVNSHGEFYGDSFYPEWKEFSATHSNVLTQDIPRSEAYITDWWPLVVQASAR